MKHTMLTKAIAALLCLLMLVGAVPTAAFALHVDGSKLNYYQIVSKRDWELAPGITESEVILTREDNTDRQVCHIVEVDPYNPYTKVMPSTYKMAEGLQSKEYSVQPMSEQAAYAEEHGYGNVVAAMNTALHWYDTDYYKEHPELIGEPLGTLIMNGDYYRNSQNSYFGAYTCLVVNFDEKDGQPRPHHIPKTEVRQTYDAITGWEEQLIPVSFHFLVKNGVNEHTINDTTEPAPRSFLGIKADGTIVMVMNEGRQEPYSKGFNCYEMAELMISMGCVQAVNCDGGGSSTFLSQRPGEELELHCSPSDGMERATTHGILVISTAPAEGELVKASLTADGAYYTPGSTVRFHARGMDQSGASADIPADAVWELADPTMGTLENGVFVSNGKEGNVTVRLSVEGETMGEITVRIVQPDSLSFPTDALAVPYGEKQRLTVNAAYQGHPVILRDEDVTVTLSHPFMGSMDGLYFTAGSEPTTPENATVTAHAWGLTARASLTLGRGSALITSFEEDREEFTPPDGWSIHTEGNVKARVYSVMRSAGKVKQGDCALAIACDFTQVHSAASHTVTVTFPAVNDPTAAALGFWLYVSRDARHARLTVGDVTVDLAELVEGWNYVSFPVSGEISSLRISVEQDEPETNGLNGKFTLYVDDLTLDYSNALPDRHAPVFSAPVVTDPTIGIPCAADGQILRGEGIVFAATVTDPRDIPNATGIAENTAQVLVDGVKIACSYSDGSVTSSPVTLPDGFHTVTFHIQDRNGNSSHISASFLVQNGAPAVTVTPRDPEADRLPVGSIYWLDVTAHRTETVEQLRLTLDLNTASTWELEGLTVAEGFTASYAIQADENILTLILTRTGENKTVGVSRIASIPVRTWVSVSSLSPAELVKSRALWAQGVEISLKQGEIVFTNRSDEAPLGVFGMEDTLVDTELFFNGAFTDSVDGAAEWVNACVSAGVGFHEHTLGAPQDLPPTSTEAGYTKRVFCADCGSVVAWGTSLPPTGHTYRVSGDRLVCDCGCGGALEGTGLQTADGKSYYTVEGKLRSGWITVEDAWYYFDPATYAGLHGEQTADSSISFAFEHGRVVKGAWVTTSAGTRYWYGPGYYADSSLDTYSARPYEIDGKTYLFNRQGYRVTGIAYYKHQANTAPLYYECGEDGVATLLTGVYNNNFYTDGVMQKAYRLVQDRKGDFYFVKRIWNKSILLIF